MQDVFADIISAAKNIPAKKIEMLIVFKKSLSYLHYLIDLKCAFFCYPPNNKVIFMVYDMARGSGGDETLRDKLIDVMYENEQLKAENSKLRETLNKAYDFMKQFVVDGRNLLERFLESIGQMVEKVRGGFRR